MAALPGGAAPLLNGSAPTLRCAHAGDDRETLASPPPSIPDKSLQGRWKKTLAPPSFPQFHQQPRRAGCDLLFLPLSFLELEAAVPAGTPLAGPPSPPRSLCLPGLRGGKREAGSQASYSCPAM